MVQATLMTRFSLAAPRVAGDAEILGSPLICVHATVEGDGATEAVRNGPRPIGTMMSFETIYRAHFPFVWRSLRRLGIREEDAADVAQEVFIIVHRKLPEFAGRSKVTTWLYGVCFRVASERRRAGPRRELGAQEAAAFVGRPADPAATAERNEGLAMLERVLDRIPDDQRAVFCLFELEGMTGEEIAEALEIPLGTAYSRLRLARVAFSAATAELVGPRAPQAAVRGRSA
jgi:RNA polymerase sigma-70 factor, ECF subfamily